MSNLFMVSLEQDGTLLVWEGHMPDAIKHPSGTSSTLLTGLKIPLTSPNTSGQHGLFLLSFNFFDGFLFCFDFVWFCRVFWLVCRGFFFS